MSVSLFLRLLLALLLVSPRALTAAEQDPLAGEHLGGLKLGQSAAEVTKRLGAPKTKGREVEWAATGDWVTEWRYPAQGLKLQMAATRKGGSKTILSIEATGPCTWPTARGIRVGSAEAEVRKAYAEVEDKEQSRAGETFVAGSVYGGVIFRFKSGKVDSIFLGAAAE